MKIIGFTKQIIIAFTATGKNDWKTHPDDLRQTEAFCTFFGYKSKSAATGWMMELGQQFPGATVGVQRSKIHAGKYQYEVKAQGIPWTFIRDYIAAMAEGEELLIPSSSEIAEGEEVDSANFQT